MSLWGKLATVFSGGATGTRMCIVDGEKMFQGNERVGPVERVQLLQRLGKYAERENITIQAVLGGRPLREADHGDELDGVKVFYADAGRDAITKQIRKLARSVGGSALVVTDDPGLETSLATSGIACLRSLTLKRAMEMPGDDEGGRSRGRRGGRDTQQRRSRSRRRRGGQNGNRSGGKQEDSEQTPASAQTGEEADVKNLIDLVD